MDVHGHKDTVREKVINGKVEVYRSQTVQRVWWVWGGCCCQTLQRRGPGSIGTAHQHRGLPLPPAPPPLAGRGLVEPVDPGDEGWIRHHTVVVEE